VPPEAGTATTEPVALAHDYLTQRGGAERVALALATAFPGASLTTSLYDPEGTYPEFARLDVRTLPLDRLKPLRTRHRLAFPLLAPAFSRARLDAEVSVCSSSGWAHGIGVTGRKVVYCHTPARWLYQSDRYLAGRAPGSGALLSALAPPLKRWDRRAAASAHRYLVNSTTVRDRVSDLYGIEAEVLPPPVEIDPDGPYEPVAGIDPGFFLCVSRLMPYKNVEEIASAFRSMPDHRLVIVGSGPLTERIRNDAPPNVTLIDRVGDAGLRWLYASSLGLIAASYEDFGLTPVEAAAFGKPTAALHWGGFLDTIVDGSTGLFFDRPEPQAIAEATERLSRTTWDADALARHARTYGLDRFVERMRTVVAEERAKV
jgi:glycosyltransferase involved in cell wall biosynthesis